MLPCCAAECMQAIPAPHLTGILTVVNQSFKGLILEAVLSWPQDAGVAAAVAQMQPSIQPDEEIAAILAEARTRPDNAFDKDAAFFAKHGCALNLVLWDLQVIPCAPCYAGASRLTS